MKVIVLSAMGTGALMLVTATAMAHHSGAMFDRSKTLEITGNVKEFQYTNPHSWLLVTVTEADGKATDWAFEAEGPSTLLKNGVKKSSVTPGEKVTVTTNPLRDGRPGGTWVVLKKADGTVIDPRRRPDAPAAAP
jgi:hypothetical protein